MLSSSFRDFIDRYMRQHRVVDAHDVADAALAAGYFDETQADLAVHTIQRYIAEKKRNANSR